MAVNVELFQAVVDAIHNDPKSHDQTTWARKTDCGTSYCVAGWTVVLGGDSIDWESVCSCEICVSFGVTAVTCTDPSGRTHTIYDRAMELLGIDNDDLFDGGNSVHDIHCHVKELTNGEVVGPSF